MSHDSSDITNALIAMLGSDATLLTYCPSGAYYDEAPPGATRFVIVTLLDASDEAVFGGRAYEDHLYLVKAVMRSDANGNIKAAAARIDAMLDDRPVGVGSPLGVVGFTYMASFRERPIRYTEVDGDDAALLWHHRGGEYRVQMAVNP